MKAADLFEFKTDQLKWGTGVRVVVVLFVPLIVMSVLNLEQYWPNLAFGVIFVGVVDLYSLGDPIGTRMRRLAITTLVGALLSALGTALGVNWELAVLGTFLITLLCGAALAWGKPAAVAAYLINIWFVASLGFQGGTAQALPQLLAWLIGGAFYMLVALVRFRRQPSSSEPAQRPISVQGSGSLFARYFALFRFTSPPFRFVFIKALAVTLAAAIGLGFGLPHAVWIPIFTLIVMQPGTEESLLIFVQRLLGTIVGAALVAVLLGSVHTPYLLVLVIVVSTFIGFAMHDVNMLTFIFLTTVSLLLLLEFSKPGDLTDVRARMLNVLIGALIAIVAVFICRPLYRPSQKKEANSAASA